MVNNHMCGDSCFGHRTAAKSTIPCLLCDKPFNMKCFNLTSPAILKLFSSDEHTVFMCSKCLERVAKIKQNHRRSTDSSIAGRSAPSLVSKDESDTQRTDSISKSNDDNNTLSKLLTTLTTLSSNFDKFSGIAEEFKNFITTNGKPCEQEKSSDETDEMNISQHVLSLHAKFDHHFNNQITIDTKNNSTIIQKLNDLHDKINFPSNQVSKFMSREKFDVNRLSVSGAIINKTTSKSDPFNWSYSFNQSSCPMDNSDIYQLLSGFEQNTWASFDYLRDKLNDNANAISNIESICKNLQQGGSTNNVDSRASSLSRQLIDSPVIDSIKLDQLQSIQDKCDNIDLNVHRLVENLNPHGQLNSEHIHEHVNISFPSSGSQHNTSHDDVAVQRPFICNTSLETEALNALNTLGVSDCNEPSTPTLIDSQRALTLNEQPQLYEFCLSNLSCTTTENAIRDYLTEKGILDLSEVKLTCLKPRGRDLSTLSYISYKLDTTESIASLMSQSNFWPPMSTFGKFNHRRKSTASLSGNTSDYFLQRAQIRHVIK